MHLLLATLTLASAEPPVEPSVENEIEVIAERMYNWSGRLGLKAGVLSCRTLGTTGDKAIDDLGCAAMLTCTVELAGLKIDSPDVVLSDEDLRRLRDTMAEWKKIGDCMVARRKLDIAALVEERRSQQP
jgi:hypothetical protein